MNRPIASKPDFQAKRIGKAVPAMSVDIGSFSNSIWAQDDKVKYQPKEAVFRQGDPASSVFYIESGNVNVTVVSEQGKEGLIAMLGTGDFFGEECLSNQQNYMNSVTTVGDVMLVRIGKEKMARLLREQPHISRMFMSFLLSRSVRVEADLIDQLFNPSERRLARILLLLANFAVDGKKERTIPKISQDLLAARVGTTRSRVNFFMNGFRKRGLIEYGAGSTKHNGGLKIHSSLSDMMILN